MAIIKPDYAASSAVTITLNSLASSSSLLGGRESTAVDNTSNKYRDYLIAGKITTGTSPTAGKTIQVFAVGLMEDATWPDVFDGTDSDETITSDGVKNGICRLIASITVESTSNRTYHFGPVSVAARFGGPAPPKKFVVFVSHDTAVALNATGSNHAIHVTPTWDTVV
jgi:hypothetical protein